MEQKGLLFSALSVGVGVGVGIGLASGQTMNKLRGINSSNETVTAQQIEQELIRLLVDGKGTKVTFEDFPYYLSERTRVLLTSAAYVHLKHFDVSKHTRNLSPASRAILLSGPAELYQQMLAKALAHHFESKLLILDVADFSIKMQSKYGCTRKESFLKRSISEATIERMSSFLSSFSLSPSEETRGSLRRQSSTMNMKSKPVEGVSESTRHRRNASTASDISSVSSLSAPTNSVSTKRGGNWCFDDKLFLQSLYRVLGTVSQSGSIILYLRDVEKLLFSSQSFGILFEKMLKRLSGSVLVLGSRILDPEDDCREVDERITEVFPYNIEIKPPEDETHLVNWKAQLEEDMKVIQFQDNKNHITEILASNDLECDDLGSICHADTMVLSNYIEEIVVSAISYHLMNTKDPEYRNGKLVISSKSLSHGLDIFQEGKSSGRDTLKLESNATEENAAEAAKTRSEGPTGENKNEIDKSIAAKKDGENASSTKAPEVVPDNEFEKRIRPEVIPASEIGVTFADIGAMDEIKDSLQELVSPTIIFVDEVDSMLGQRTRVGEHEAMRKIKNEFMSHWDGLLTKSGERILVLAATNRPFDLDEAIIRRFERRIMVGLPSVENREMILKTLLAKEKTEGLDFKELAMMTEGYSGSDLKNLCTTAAYRPVRELIKQEILKDQEKKKKEEEAKNSEEAAKKPEEAAKNSEEADKTSEEAAKPLEEASSSKEEVKVEQVITLRPLNMEDMRKAKNQVAASFAAEGAIMGELKQWNELYGEGGSRKKQQLTYFL
ncbi:hypothetical protein ACFE04_027604 [Oxalis oulophora]